MSRLKAIVYNAPKVYVCALAHKAVQLYGGLLELSSAHASTREPEKGAATHCHGILIEASFMKAFSAERLKRAVGELKDEWKAGKPAPEEPQWD